MQNSLLNSLLAGNLRGDWGAQHGVPSQPVRPAKKPPLIVAEMPANGGLLRIGYRSLGSEFGHFRGENAESLRLHAEIFPFSGDYDRRPVSIHTTWRTRQCN